MAASVLSHPLWSEMWKCGHSLKPERRSRRAGVKKPGAEPDAFQPGDLFGALQKRRQSGRPGRSAPYLVRWMPVSTISRTRAHSAAISAAASSAGRERSGPRA